MFVAVAVIVAFLIGGTIRRSLVPGRVQSVVELTYEFVANTIRSTAGPEGMRFFPFVFTLFMTTLNLVRGMGINSMWQRNVSYYRKLLREWVTLVESGALEGRHCDLR